jgi:hypothetical protein
MSGFAHIGARRDVRQFTYRSETILKDLIRENPLEGPEGIYAMWLATVGHDKWLRAAEAEVSYELLCQSMNKSGIMFADDEYRSQFCKRLVARRMRLIGILISRAAPLLTGAGLTTTGKEEKKPRPSLTGGPESQREFVGDGRPLGKRAVRALVEQRPRTRTHKLRPMGSG